MRKRAALALLLAALLALMSACAPAQQDVDLTSVSIDNIPLGAPIDHIDLSKYTPLPQPGPEAQNTYVFKQLRLFTDGGGRLRAIWADTAQVQLGMRYGKNPRDIRAVKMLLGETGQDAWHDQAAGMRSMTYTDARHNITATFIYRQSDGRLTQVILQG
nr:hypothetical protein [Maliibacterium massiliense]